MFEGESQYIFWMSLYSTVYRAIAGTPVSALHYPQFRSAAPCCGVEAETDTNQDTERRGVL